MAQFALQDIKRYEDFRCHGMAPGFLIPGVLNRFRSGIRQSRHPQPEMGKFMDKGQHLDRLRICTIDEGQWGHGISKCEAAKFGRIEPTVTVRDRSARHHKHSGQVGMPD